MKKLILSIGLTIVAMTTMAQVHTSQSFLNVKALQVGTNSVGYMGLTNLQNLTTNVGMIYSTTNLAYTNAAGTYIHPGLAAVVSAMGTTNSYSVPVLFKDVALWTDRNGQPVYNSTLGANAGTSLNSNLTYVSSANLFIEYVAGAWLTNGAIGLQFRPIWDGVTPNNYTADDWWVVLPSSAGVQQAKVNMATNAPVWRWPGAKALRLTLITNNVTTVTAGATTVTNSPFITKVLLNGFIP